MSEMPEDIRIAARSYVGHNHRWLGPDEVTTLLARAILAERKRCAEAVLAEKLAGETSDPTDISYNVAIGHAHDAIWRAA